MKPEIAHSKHWAAAVRVTAILDDPQQSVPPITVCTVLSILMLARALKKSESAPWPDLPAHAT